MIRVAISPRFATKSFVKGGFSFSFEWTTNEEAVLSWDLTTMFFLTVIDFKKLRL
jgi:hypothetical protein